MRGYSILIVSILVLLSSIAYAQNIEVKIYQDTDVGKDYGDIKAVPGESIAAFVEVENLNDDRSDEDQDIEGVEITATLEDIDDGEDIEEDYDSFDMKARRKESVAFPFNVPLRIEEKKYQLKVIVEGSENGTDFSLSEEFFVDVDKERNQLYVDKLRFDPQSVGCNSAPSLQISIYNIGTQREDITLNIENKKLGFSVTRKFELFEYPDEDIYENSIPVKIPADAESGVYDFEVLLEYAGGEVLQRESAAVQVQCSGDSQGVQDDSSQTVSPEDKETGQTAVVQGGNTPNNDAPQAQAVAARLQQSTPPPEIVQNKETSIVPFLTTFIIIAMILLVVLVVILLKRK